MPYPPQGFFPVAHAPSHQDDGDDEISLAGLSGEPTSLTTHKGRKTGTHGVGSSYIAKTGQSSQIPDHGELGGLDDDNHAQYYNDARHTRPVHEALGIDHGSLGGLGDDDHSQYYNDARHTRPVHEALGIDHGSLGGLGDDDHAAYVKTDGSRAFSGDQSMGGHRITDVGEGSNIPGRALNPRYETGYYVGDGAEDGRQIATGFRIRAAIVQMVFTVDSFLLSENLVQSTRLTVGQRVQGTNSVHAHSTDGFMVGDGSAAGNVDGEMYSWVAFGR